MSHAEHHNHLTGAKKLDTSLYSHVVSVRSDNLKSWLNKGYEIISDSDDSSLVGLRKSDAEIQNDKEVNEWLEKEAKAQEIKPEESHQ